MAENSVSLKLPKHLSLSEYGMPVVWKLWIQQFEWYAIATNLESKTQAVQAESKNLSLIKTKFDAYFAPKTIITYKRYLFNKITQAEVQPFDDFLTSVINQGNKCEFGELYNSLLRDKIVVGVCSDTVREKLPAEKELMFDKTVKICRASEITKLQVSAMRGDTLPSMHAIHISHKKILSESQDTDFKTRNKCPKCGYNLQRTCSAVGKECKKCDKWETGQTPELSSSETFFPSYSDIHHKKLDWIEKLTLLNGNSVSFKLDTGAQCNFLSSLIAQRALITIRPSKTKLLVSFSKDSVPVLGKADVKVFTNKNMPYLVTFLIVDKGHQCILGFLKRIETAIFNGEVFDGIGCLKAFAYDMDLIDQPNLYIYPPRRVPYSIPDKVKEELDSMVQNDVIELITEPTPAVSPMVVVHKIEKRRHFPLQIIEEIAARLKGSKYFTLLDYTKGFWQIKVTDRISQYLTFDIPWGRYKCKRLPFGLASAPEIFQQIICHTLHGIKGAECSVDDILLHAESINELGAITEIVILLGMINYLLKFIPRVAERSAPLRKLLEKDAAWHWELKQENAFEDLKDNLNHSMASVLLQENHSVFYASKALTKTQQNYSQIEIEAFAMLPACKKFHEYIWGNQEVTIETDHKPLEAIFKKPLHDSPARLHKIQFEILPYNPTIGYKKGSELYIADTLSSDCHEIPEPDVRVVYKVQVVIPMSVQCIAHLKDAIHTSTKLSALCRFILQGWPDMIQQGREPSYHPLGSPSACHSCTAHKGVQGTLAIACGHVFCPGMTQDIISFVQKCATCKKIQNDPPQESLSEETAPSRPWMYVASDPFHYKGKNYLLVADCYSVMKSLRCQCRIKILGMVQQFHLQGFLQKEVSQKYQSHSSPHQQNQEIREQGTTVTTREAPLQIFEGSVMTRNISPLL
ncbi:hypothetical protein PR048_011291 [Dryococelus australis]|uniref:RNA-directed DNA polymerase n=1 Tax=Dryococelus australis TaxID=614101 RepID=A0ABQ9HLD5_9NEOP|nr:hypothetical protein PR048_011291 [Dryococelus australis]